MNILTKTAVATAAVIATAVVPVSSAMAAGKPAPVSGKHHVHKGGPGYYKKGPRVHYPRGHYKKPPVVVHKGKNNAAAMGLLGFAAGAIIGGALANGS
ncbi:hypothetical protein [Hoeflea poritis]|uniref:Transmembrane protein n=1 Tax=Hoeflea poritis TaxID=2993659 RepID=A0ABT4VRH4_9HYPH|nr:hypothetical protein [Hoeflea poritis]MDA4847306.1 hypothetical protein [Hoeflea poritis]